MLKLCEPCIFAADYRSIPQSNFVVIKQKINQALFNLLILCETRDGQYLINYIFKYLNAVFKHLLSIFKNSIQI